MSALILLDEDCWIDPMAVIEVSVDTIARTIAVRMQNGIGHSLIMTVDDPRKAAENIVARINAARAA